MGKIRSTTAPQLGCQPRLGLLSRLLLSAPPFKQVALAREPFADEIEEGSDARRALEVGMGHDPKLAFNVRHRLGQDPLHADGVNQIVGGRYKLHILCVLHRGPHRFGEIGRSLLKGGLGKPITPRILSRELKELGQRGLIERKPYPVVPRKVEYSLTERGRALLPILAEIIRWGATGAHKEILGIA